MGLFSGLRIKVPDPKALPETKDEWILILGGAGSVGQYAVQVRITSFGNNEFNCVFIAEVSQLAKLSGYKVVATSSTKTASVGTSF